jgi:hypothetical protein
MFSISLEEEWRGCCNLVDGEQSPPRHEMAFLYRTAIGKCMLSNARRVQGFKSGMVPASETAIYPTLCLRPSNSQGREKEYIHYSPHLFFIFAIYIESPPPQVSGSWLGATGSLVEAQLLA